MAANIFILVSVPDSTAQNMLENSDAIAMGKVANNLELQSNNTSGRCHSKWNGSAWVSNAQFPPGAVLLGKNIIVTGPASGDRQGVLYSVGQQPPNGSAFNNFVQIDADGAPSVPQSAGSTCAESDGTTVTYYRRYSVDCSKCI